jgi:hypothetical protein
MPSPKRPRNVPESASSSNRPERRRDAGVVSAAVHPPPRLRDQAAVSFNPSAATSSRRCPSTAAVSWHLVAFEVHLVS